MKQKIRNAAKTVGNTIKHIIDGIVDAVDESMVS
jgi:hypothetical protein